MRVALWAVAVVLALVGIVGVAVPVLPGPALVLAGIAVAAWIDDFTRISLWALAVATLLALAAIAVDYASQALGAKRFGGSGWGIAGAFLGLIVGLVFFGPLGMLLGPAIGATALELAGARKNAQEALRSGLGTFVGYLLGTAVRYALVFAMLGIAIGSYVI